MAKTTFDNDIVVAMRLHAEGLLNQATARYMEILEEETVPEVKKLLNILEEQKKEQDALPVEHRFQPGSAAGYCRFASALLAIEDLDNAELYFHKSLDVIPEYAPAHIGLGWVNFVRANLDAADHYWSLAYHKNPELGDTLNNLVMSKNKRGRPDQAAALLQFAIKNGASDVRTKELILETRALLDEGGDPGENLFHGGLVDQAEEVARQRLAKENSLENHNFLLKCYLASPRHTALDFFNESRAWCVANGHEELLPKPEEFKNKRDPVKRLKVGIVGDYFTGVIGNFTLIPFFKLYDRSQLELYCYNFGPGEEIIREHVDFYRAIHNLSDNEFYDLVKRDEIDIVLDINGRLRTPNFFNALLRQPAPIIVNWYNMSATIGSRAYNYIIADELCVPFDDSGLYVEKIFHMPTATTVCWEMGPPSEVPPPPAIRNGYLTFACFADFFKVNSYVLEAWIAILKSTSRSRLYLKSNNFRLLSERNRMLGYFESHGIERDRLILEGLSPYPIMEKLYEKVDIALDTFPYSSGSTTVNAIWHGVPVITIRGRSYRELVSTSILSGVSLFECITTNSDEYVQKAVDLAGNIDYLTYLRSNLGKTAASSPQWQMGLFAQNFQTVLRNIWQDWLMSAG